MSGHWQYDLWLEILQVSHPPITNVKLRKPSPDFHLTFTWASDHHLTFPRPLFNLKEDFKLHLNFTWTSPELHLTFTWHSLTFTWHSHDNLTIMWTSPDPYLTFISSLQIKKMLLGGWGGGGPNPLQTLSQGLVLTLRFTFGPELDNKKFQELDFITFSFIENKKTKINNC